jgi:transcriptional regulator with GAF, ATPase, and Fis domain
MNAGGLSEGVAESELFGHVKGAFTDARTDRIGCFELADEGTLFLDEIANMPIGCSRSCCACCRPARCSVSARRA